MSSQISTAVITGAGSGIGRAVAQEFANNGVRLLLVGRRLAMLQDTLDSLSGDGHSVVAVDVTNAGELKAAIDDFANSNNGLDCLIANAGINPQPIQKPIPIWMGAGARANPVPTDRVLKRVAWLSDGWFPQMQPGDDAKATVERLKIFADEAGRDGESIGMEPRINLADGNPELWQSQARAWEEMGATHVSVNTMRAGLSSPQDHINAIQQFKEVIG
jgi:alkanesulfonate monooxygenase SsuD/methylene tetrahydromethanopterin reductase-like flavin-dependent oxidoreductase (luciferase family)